MDKITVEECRGICKNCLSRINFAHGLNKYGVGRCLKNCCMNYTVAPMAKDLVERIIGIDHEPEDVWD